MAELQAVVGLKFNHLTILERLPRDPASKSRMPKVLAQCDCGSKRPYFLTNLKVGNSKSCGCAEFSPKEKAAPAPPREYAAWRNMKQRCLNEKSGYFPAYGGRGITVCEEWVNSFPQFLKDMGSCPDGMALGRRDVDGGYSPENCLWTDRKSLALNRRPRQS